MDSKAPGGLAAFEIVKVVDLSPIHPADDALEPYKFRIEILRELEPPGQFRARVWRRETFRITPTYPTPEEQDQDQDSWDEEIIIADTAGEWEKIRGESAEEALEQVLGRIKETFQLG